MNHVDLFAGIGGFTLGFQNAGIHTVAHIEKDKNCQVVIKKHWPDTILISDVCDAGKHNLPKADIITFGSPCQDLSIAGKRAGLTGARSGLFHEAIRIIRELEPAIAIWENVPGALSSSRGEDFRAVLTEMLGTEVPMPRSGRWATAGMVRTGEIEVAWRILDAQYFGVPQRRRRVFVVRSVGELSASEILFERESVSGDPPTRGKAGEGIAYSLRRSPSHSGDKGDGGINTTLRSTGGDLGGGSEVLVSTGWDSHSKRIHDSNGLAPTLQHGEGSGSIVPSIAVFQQNTRDEVRLMGDDGQIVGALAAQAGMKQQNYIATETVGALQTRDAKGIGTTIDDKIIAFSSKDYGADAQEDITPTLRSASYKDSHQQGGGNMAVAWEMQHASEAYRETNGQVSPTLQQRMGTGGNNVPLVGVRRLTPVECERLQGFPDGWTDGQADTQRYKQLGNAVAVPVVEWIGKRIVALDGYTLL